MAARACSALDRSPSTAYALAILAAIRERLYGVSYALAARSQVERLLMLSGVERDRALQSPHRCTQHRLLDILGILPGQYRVPRAAA